MYIQWKKIVKNITSWHKTLLASTISKHVSRCCIHFLHELTSQILTNQSIKIGRRAWPKVTVLSAYNSWLNFRVRGQFAIKIIMMRHIMKQNLFHIVSYEFFKKNWITSKNDTRSLWTRDTVRWYCPLDTPVLTAVNWSQHWCAIWVHIEFAGLPNYILIARKCEIKHWYACGADGRAGGVRSRD